MQIKIEVLRDGEPVVDEYVKIRLGIKHGTLADDIFECDSCDDYTDEDGIVEFDTNHHNHDYITINVDGEEHDYDDPYDGCSYTINL